jgi:hypothetical protein
VRLDGRGARPTRPGRRLSWRWRILRKPRGSRARLVRGSSATPRLPIDVRGRYTLRERVTERPAGRRRGGGTRTTSHLVSVLGDTNAPPIGASLQVDLTQYSKGGGSITIDDAPSAGLPDRYDCASNPTSGANRCVYKMPNPDNATYLLVLDARTLEPKAPIATVGAVCPTDDDLRSAIGPWAGQNVIAILTSAAACVFSSPDSLVDVSGPYTYIFTPTTKPDLGIRSGWYSESPTVGNEIPDERPAEISGYLQKSWPVGSRQASEQYQFVPGNYVAYDTSKAGSPAGQNTMVVAGKEYTSRLPGGATDGFQVLVLDKTLNPMLDTPKAFANGAPVGDMAKLLEQARTTPGVSTVLVQSIGRPSPYSVSANDAWNSAAAQLEQLGGNTDVFLNLKGPDWPRPAGTSGWYSLVAAPDPSCLPSSPLPCESEAEASTPLTQRDGDLSGVLARNQRWQYAPLLDRAGGETGDDIETLAYQKPQTWPYSDAASRPVLEYLANYQQGAVDLTWLKTAACYDPGPRPDVRSSYCSDRAPWEAIHSDLGDSRTNRGVCADYPGADVVKVSEDVYHRICDRISLEALWLDTVHKDMDKVKTQAFNGEQGLTAYMAVSDMVREAEDKVETSQAKAGHNVAAEGLELAGESLELLSQFAAESVGPVGEIFAGTLALAGEATSSDEGEEQGESAFGQVVKVAPSELGDEMVKRLNAASLAFDHSWEVIVSDPAKLETAYNNFKGPWNGVPEQMDNVKPMIQNGVRHWASGKFMAATYDVWMVDTSQDRSAARDVGPSDVQTIGCDRRSSFGNSTTWAAFYGAPPEAAYYLRDRLGLTQPNPRYGSNMWVFAWGDVSDPHAARVWPPASLIDQLLAPPQTQGDKPAGGYGWERPWLYSRGQRFNIHGPGWEARVNGCHWFAGDRYPVCSWAPPPCTPRSAASSATSDIRRRSSLRARATAVR